MDSEQLDAETDTLPSDPTALYRWFDATDRLLYIGISKDMWSRTSSHVGNSRWMDLAARSTVHRYPSRDEAADAETAAIKAEHPLFNKKHNDTPEAKERLRAYLEKIGRMDLLEPARRDEDLELSLPAPSHPPSKQLIAEPKPQRQEAAPKWWGSINMKNVDHHVPALSFPRACLGWCAPHWSGASGSHVVPTDEGKWDLHAYEITGASDEEREQRDIIQRGFFYALTLLSRCGGTAYGSNPCAFGFPSKEEAQAAGTFLIAVDWWHFDDILPTLENLRIRIGEMYSPLDFAIRLAQGWVALADAEWRLSEIAKGKSDPGPTPPRDDEESAA